MKTACIILIIVNVSLLIFVLGNVLLQMRSEARLGSNSRKGADQWKN